MQLSSIVREKNLLLSNTICFYQFSEEGEERRFYYHTQKTRELDNLLGDIYHKILGSFCIPPLFHPYDLVKLL
jgi:hypothetical protein